ncbi:MAG: CCA tRNA nucleotidyltransferase [Candidatus Bathyarchaeia archaeon]
MNLQSLKEYVAEKVTPQTGEYDGINKVIDEVLGRVKRALKAHGIEAIATLEGSVAKDTWLSGEADVDIFIQVPPFRDKRFLEAECLSAIKRGMKGYTIIERYSEHPYIEAYVKDVRINVVPCFRVERGEWLSAADRTPYHTGYMKEKLTPMLRREIRVLKRLLKGIGIYGAEARVKGFSGLLCELLTLNYGSFIELVKAASKWRRRELIDVEGYYQGRELDALKLFPEPLVVVDPIDPNRNAAAAVAEDTMWGFVSVSRLLLEKPDIRFFYPKVLKPDKGSIRDILEKAGGDLVVIDIGVVDAVVDVVWSQLFKAEKVLRRILSDAGFRVIRSASWSSPENRCRIFLKLESGELSLTHRHLGPPVEMMGDSDKFLACHLKAHDTAAGPWLEGGRWIVEKLRRYRRADRLIAEKLLDGGKSAGVPGEICESLKKSFRVILNEEVLVLAEIPGALEEAYRFLSGRPIWLDAAL